MKENTAWIRLGLCVATVVAAMALAWGRFGHEVEDNTEFRKEDGAKNTEHRHRFEEKVNTMAISIEAIRKVVEK